MAVVKWKTPAYRLFNEYVESALLEYGKKRLYRSCRMMGGRFRLVYYYNPHTDIVRIVDIWDTRMNPETLIKRI